jgi:hypothetical protein
MPARDDFITAYKRLEEELKVRKRMDVFSYEKTLEPYERKKLQLCRLIRNFLQHENEEFVEPTAQMAVFLNILSDALSGTKRGKSVEEKYEKVKPVSEDDVLKAAASRVSSQNPEVVVVGSDGRVRGLFTKEQIRKSALMDIYRTRVAEVALNRCTRFCSLSDSYADLEDGEQYAVTDTGDGSGKYLGVVKVRQYES